MVKRTVGIVETEGLLDAFLAADAMTKGSMVKMLGSYFLGDGLVTLVVMGPPGVVRSAISMAEATERHRRGEMRTGIIPNISKNVIEVMLFSTETAAGSGAQKKSEKGMSRNGPGRSPTSGGDAVPSIFSPDLGKILKKTTARRKRTNNKPLRRLMGKNSKGKNNNINKRQTKLHHFLMGATKRKDKITISDIERVFPNTSRRVLQTDLRHLIKIGKVRKVGRTRSTHYQPL